MDARTRGSLGWRHAHGDTVTLSHHVLASGAGFSVAGVPIAKDMALIEAGFDFDLTDAAMLGVAYRGQLSSSAREHAFNAKLSIEF